MKSQPELTQPCSESSKWELAFSPGASNAWRALLDTMNGGAASHEGLQHTVGSREVSGGMAAKGGATLKAEPGDAAATIAATATGAAASTQHHAAPVAPRGAPAAGAGGAAVEGSGAPTQQQGAAGKKRPAKKGAILTPQQALLLRHSSCHRHTLIRHTLITYEQSGLPVAPPAGSCPNFQ